jgi:hypothetical protein
MQWLTGDDGPQLNDVTADTPNAAEIRRVAAKGWLAADDQKLFRPNDPVTRAQFVIAVNKMLGRNDAGGQKAQGFKDVDASHWAFSAIMEATQTHPIAADEGHFLFVTFKGEATPLTEQVYFCLSTGGRTWETLNGGRPVLQSDVGEKGVRDPYLLRSPDGKRYFLLGTDLSINRNRDWKRASTRGSRAIIIWESEDLVRWSEPRRVEVASDDAGCTWAPEAIYDEEAGDYLVFWASRNASDNFAKFRIWASRTKDFRQFSKPQVYIDRPFPVIDTTIVRDGGQYYRFSKREDQAGIIAETSKRLTGEWAAIEGFSLAATRGVEGPQCHLLRPASGGRPAEWCLLLDHYARGQGYKAYVTSNLAGGHFQPADAMAFPFPLRHGSVVSITPEEHARLKRVYGADAAP